MLAQRSQHGFEVLQVYEGVIALRRNSDVVAIHDTVSRLDVICQNKLHKTLKSTRHAGQTKRSTDKLVKARGSGKRSLAHIRITHAQPVKHAVVDHHTQLTILLGREEHWCRIVRATALDNACVKKSFHLAVELRLMGLRNGRKGWVAKVGFSPVGWVCESAVLTIVL
jgi:hypothetical protein